VFRATFEDKILKSDLIFCKTWFSVEIPKLFNPAVHYGKTRFLKSHAELRRENNLKIPQNQDSVYVRHNEKLDQERDERVFNGL
jgi:ribosome biogenesis protein BMS1